MHLSHSRLIADSLGVADTGDILKLQVMLFKPMTGRLRAIDQYAYAMCEPDDSGIGKTNERYR
jgi:hypothetical protein